MVDGWGNATAPTTTSALLRFVSLYPRREPESRPFFGALLSGLARRSGGAAPPPPVGAPHRDGHTAALRDALGGHDVRQQARCQERAATDQTSVGEPGRDLLAVVGDEDDRRAGGGGRPARGVAGEA